MLFFSNFDCMAGCIYVGPTGFCISHGAIAVSENKQ